MKFIRMLNRIISCVMAMCMVIMCLSPALVAFASTVPNVYTRLDETYHEMTGFESDDVATVGSGSADTEIKNNGVQSQKFTVGDNTYSSVSITLNKQYPLADANYVQFWVNNTANTDQYLLNMSFKKNNVFQYNVPVGKEAILIADGSTTETKTTWGSTKITGAGTMRSLLIPAGFSGYVRISVDAADLAPTKGSYDADTFNTTEIFSFYFGNTATGGNVYIDDLGYIKSSLPTTNTVYLKELENYTAITGFEKDDTATVTSGSVDTAVKNNGYRSQKWTVGDNTFIQANILLNETCAFSDASYVQFWINNTADTTQYLLSMSFKKDGVFQYNIPVGAEALLIADNTSAEQSSIWSSIKINGAGTMRGLAIPAGFSGYVRVSVAEEDLQPKSGTYDADTFDTANNIGFYFGNTATGGDVYIDDFGCIFKEEIQSVTNTIYTEETEKFYSISGFETEDIATPSAGENAYEVKNNGLYSHCYTVGDNTFVTSNIDLGKTYPFSNAKYIQFWVNNATAVDQYLFNMSFKGDGFQYNVPTGAEATLIYDNTLETSTQKWFSQVINGAGTVRALTIPAGFSGYVRVLIDSTVLQVYAPSGSAFDADVFDNTNKIGFNFANTSTGGDIYIDDLGYIVENTSSVYIEEGETYHKITSFDDKKGGGPVNTDNGYSTAVKNSGSRSFMYTVPAANYVNIEGKNPSTPNVTFEANADLANAKYMQLWMSNTSEDPIYLFNFSIQKPGSFQYRVKAGADVQLIDENAQTIVNAARWAYVTIGNFQKSRAIKIPAGFTGYIRIPVSADDMQVVAPSGASYNSELLTTANLITYYLGSQADGGKVYVDDVGFITGGDDARAGMAFADLSEKKTFVDDTTGVSMAYRLYLPENYNSNTKYPVVLYLHGNGFQGDDNLSHVTSDIGEPLDELVSLGNRSDYPCIIVAPQCPVGYKWVNTTFANGSYSVDSIAETNAMKTAVNLLNAITEEYSVDQDRIYAAGVSMGAFGCWDIMIRHRGLLAAAIPMMGAGDPSKAIYVGNTAVWAFHCANDNTVPVSGTKDMIEAMQSIEGSNVKYTEYSGVGHAAYRFAIAEEELLPWLFAQVRDLENMPDLPTPPPPPEAVTNDIYLQDGDTYFEITGFESDDKASMAGGAVDVDNKNNGYQSQKITVGDDTFTSIALTLNDTYPLSESAYLQLWINNNTDSDQYLLGMNFQGSGFQYNVPAGVTSWLIADGATEAIPVVWTNIQITGADTIRSLKIPAGFSGYVRISTQPKDLEVKVPVGATFDKEKFDTTTRIGLYIGNAHIGGEVYIDDIGYITNPNIKEEKPIEPESNQIYLQDGDTYHEISGFEADDSVKLSAGKVDVSVKNNGYQSHCLAVGDNTFVTSNILLDTEYSFSSAKYIQFWLNNDTGADQYLFNMSFKGDGFQYNVPTGAEAILIADDTLTISTNLWTSVKIKGADTVRALLIPAGFSGYVRVDVTRKGLQVSVPSGAMFDVDTLNKTDKIGFNIANTSTGGNIYLDDFGFITNPKYEQEKIKPVTNDIYLQDGDTYHEITGFESDDAVTSSKGEPSTDVRNNGYQSGKYTIGDNTFTQAIFKFNKTYELSKASYLQFWINNSAKSDQYLLSMSFQGSDFQYNVPTGAPVMLISDNGGQITEAVWESTRIEGAGTMRSLLIPAGFSGYIRVSLRPEHLAPKVGTYNASIFNKTTRISIYMGNTSTGGNLYFDDLGYITNPNYTGLSNENTSSSNNPIYLVEGDAYHNITGFEAGDRVASSSGVPSTDIKNNGSQSHKYTTGDKKYIQAKLTLNDNYPFSNATSIQFWIKNDTKADQYLMSISFQGDGFQYNVPTGAECQFIDDATKTVVTKTWESIRVADAGTTRAVLVPAGFSGYVRVPVTMYDLRSLKGRYDAAKIDAAKIISLYFGNNSTGGDIYLDDLGYIINPNDAVEGVKPEGEPVKNDIFLNDGDKYHTITGFEIDDTDVTNPFDRKSHMVNNVKNNGHFGYQFCLPEADFVNASISFENIPEIVDSEYLQFWFSNPTDNNIYMFNFSFSDGSKFQYNVSEETNIYLIQDGETEPTLAVWTNPKLGTYKGRSFVIPLGFSGYVRIPLDKEALTIKKPVDGKYDANLFAKTQKISFYMGNITTSRNVYMDDVMFIDGEVMKDVIPDYSIDYSKDMLISLYGRILDESGKPLKNATLVLDNYTTTKTDGEGRFVFTGVSMDCHTLAVVDENNKIIAQTAITIMPGEETYLIGTYISKHKDVTSLIVDMQLIGTGIKLTKVTEGELTVDTYVNEDSLQNGSNKLSNVIVYIAIAIGVIIVALAAFILIKKFFKKS